MLSIGKHGSRSGVRARGFTLIEMMIVVVIVGVLLAVGVPSLTTWVSTNKAAATTEFYMEGFRMARQQAVGHNAASRIVLTTNNSNGQLDWQVDLCYPTSAVPCSDSTGNWSTPSTSAAGDQDGAAAYTSVFRAADNLPKLDVVVPTVQPSGAFAIYYSPLGWADPTFATRLSRIRFDPAAARAGQFASTAIVVTLAGMPSKCDPTVAVTDSRGCPP